MLFPKTLRCWPILLLALLPSLSILAQALYGLSKDSLRQAIAKQPEDTLKVATYIYLGQQYENSQPDSAIYYYQKAGHLSQKLNYPAGYVRYINNYTAVLNLRGQFKESLQLNLQALSICQEQMPGSIRYAMALVNAGNVYELIDNHDAAEMLEHAGMDYRFDFSDVPENQPVGQDCDETATWSPKKPSTTRSNISAAQRS